jgi:hypothetical protein
VTAGRDDDAEARRGRQDRWRSVLTDSEEKMVLALLDDDPDELADAAGELDYHASFRILSAAFVAAVYLQFPQTASVIEAVEFTDYVRAGARFADELDTTKLEAAIRAVLGEPEMLEGISANDLVPIYLAVIRCVLDDHDTAAYRDEFLASVQEALE